MFSNFAISLLIGVGFGVWLYTRFQRRGGGSSAKNSAIAAAIAAIVVTMFLTYILDFVFHKFGV
jgi:predicted RND superfamily exporter protein